MWGYVWNIKVTIVSPDTTDLKIFHDDDDFPDIVIIHNGRAEPEKHYFSTCMHDPSSKKLPIYGSNHSYKITELTDIKHHSKLTEAHYKEVKQQQCIHDYNAAVDNLSTLYDNIMRAKEEEMEMEEALKKVKISQAGMEKCVNVGTDHLLLAKAKLQSLGVSTSNLNKMKPVTQRTQIETMSSLQSIVSILEDESDKAVRALIHSQKTSTIGSSVLEGAIATYARILPEGIIAAPMPDIRCRDTSTVVTSTSTAVPSTSTVVASTSGQQTIPQLEVPVIVNIGKQVEVITLNEEEEEEKIPKGYKATKYPNTLEKIKLTKPTEGQEAPKRFFCTKCMSKNIKTGQDTLRETILYIIWRIVVKRLKGNINVIGKIALNHSCGLVT